MIEDRVIQRNVPQAADLTTGKLKYWDVNL
jgi:hypothetical protein